MWSSAASRRCGTAGWIRRSGQGAGCEAPASGVWTGNAEAAATRVREGAGNERRRQKTAQTTDESTFEAIRDAGIVAVVRAPSAKRAEGIARELIESGLSVIEVAFTVPDAAEAIGRLSDAYPEAFVGAGTVLRPDQAKAAIRAGARFLFSPGLHPNVGDVAKAEGTPYIPGVLTPTEVAQALSAGFRVLKLFPAIMAGLAGMRALGEPFPEARFIPTGGIEASETGRWLRAGALAVGMGSYLTKVDDPAARARELLGEVHKARAGAALPFKTP